MYWNEITGGNYLLNSASWLKTWFVVVMLLWLWLWLSSLSHCGCCRTVIIFVVALLLSLLHPRCVVAIVASLPCHVMLSLSPHHHRCCCVVIIVAVLLSLLLCCCHCCCVVVVVAVLLSLSHCRHVVAIASLPCHVASSSSSSSHGAHRGAGPRVGAGGSYSVAWDAAAMVGECR